MKITYSFEITVRPQFNSSAQLDFDAVDVGSRTFSQITALWPVVTFDGGNLQIFYDLEYLFIFRIFSFIVTSLFLRTII